MRENGTEKEVVYMTQGERNFNRESRKRSIEREGRKYLVT